MEITYGAGRVKIYRRSDGRWILRWKEAGKIRSTTFSGTKANVEKQARKIAKDLDRVSGGRIVSVAEVELLDRVRDISGGGSLHQFIDKLDGLMKTLPHGWTLVEATDFLQRYSSRINVEKSISISDAYEKLMDYYDRIKASPHTRLNPRKEIKVYGKKYPKLQVRDLTREEMLAWIDRGNPAPQYFNNRLATWKAFLTKCQEWGYLDEERKHILAGTKKRKVPKKSPAILTVNQLHKSLKVLQSEISNVQAAFMIGCWAGLRPFEIKRLKWEDIDFSSGYIHVSVEVSRKLIRERFVPLQPCLERHLKSIKGTGRICMTHHWVKMAKALKENKVIESWPQDLLRHSFCSYRLAQSSNASKVADEAGNSPDVVRGTYRRPLKKEDGDAWFTVA